MAISATSAKIPYVISEAHPDWKRPYIDNRYGVIEEDKMDDFFLEEVINFILERYVIKQFQSVEDITDFFEHFYTDNYMENSPWKAYTFMDGEWIDATPDDDEIFEYMNKHREKLT